MGVTDMDDGYPICKHCRSDNVGRDAAAHWDKEEQAWMVATTFDDAYCNECGGETTLIWIKKED
jgi:hypothetical protein